MRGESDWEGAPGTHEVNQHWEHRREPTLGTEEGNQHWEHSREKHCEHGREKTLGTLEGTNTGNTGKQEVEK